MKKIEIETINKSNEIIDRKTVKVYDNFDEISLGQFIEWNELDLRNYNYWKRNIEFVSLFTDLEKEEVGKLDRVSFERLLEPVSEFVNKGFPEIRSDEFVRAEGRLRFEIEDKVYYWEPDYFLGEVELISKMEHTLERLMEQEGCDIFYLFHYALAFVCVEEDEEFNLFNLESKAQLFYNNLIMDKVFNALFFSLIEGRSLEKFIQQFSLGKKGNLSLAAARRVNLHKSGLGMIREFSRQPAESLEMDSKRQEKLQ